MGSFLLRATMTYISSGRVVHNCSKLRLSYIAELFWAIINFIAIFFQTLISTEATEGAIKRGQSRGYDRPVKRPIGTLHGKEKEDQGTWVKFPWAVGEVQEDARRSRLQHPPA